MINFFLGDARLFWPENIKFFMHLPSAWDSSLNTGIGISQVNTLWITSYLNFTAFFTNFGLSWSTIYIVFWVLPTIIIAFLSTFFLFRLLINKKTIFAVLAGIIFTVNTYFMLIFFGGQSGVCFAYAFIPLVFLVFFKLIRSPDIYSSLLAGLVFSLQVLFDPRLAGLTIVSILLYYLVRFKFSKKDLLYFAIIPFLVVFLLHSFWILPSLFYKSNIIPEGFTSLEGIKFLSFASFENTLSLLHPNWPENIFGKVYFMKPEFLVIPILAYSSLFFVNMRHSGQARMTERVIIFFALLGLLSAFLAKGANEPFGQLFLWLVSSVPGFSIFRDSTKFYSLIALSFAILIPFSILHISEKFKKFVSHKVLVGIFLLFWLFSLRLLFVSPAFKTHQVPAGYVQLKDFIVSNDQFFRTLWIPAWQRYGYFSDIHPAIGRNELFKEASASGMIKQINKEEMIPLMQQLSVKYIIVPEDSEGEFFLNDRKYDEKIYKKTIFDLEKISSIKKVQTFGKTVVFEVPDPRDRFWSPSTTLKINYNFVYTTSYRVTLQNAQKGDLLIFSEGFDHNWQAKIKESGQVIQSTKYNHYMNSFILPEDGNYTVLVSYVPQKMVLFGLMISGVVFSGTIFFLLKKLYKRKL